MKILHGPWNWLLLALLIHSTCYRGGSQAVLGDEAPVGEAKATEAIASLVRYGKEQLALDEVIARYSQDAKLAKYREMQLSESGSAQDHVSRADWCKQHGLPEQEKAHLLRALDFEPDNAAIRRRLGHVRGEREWLSKEAAVEKERRENQQAFATSHWTPRVEEWQRLTQTSAASREKAISQMQAIRDPLAIPALEAVLPKEQDLATLFVEILSQIDAPQATAALMRLAVESEFADAREAATAELKKLDSYQYVPAMLASLRGPIKSSSALNVKGRHFAEYTQHLTRAAYDFDELLDIKINVKRVGNENNRWYEQIMLRRREVEDKSLTKAVAKENEMIDSRNARIIAVLQATTGHTPREVAINSSSNASAQSGTQANEPTLKSDPQPWWNWWKTENEVSEQRTRGQVKFYRTSSVVVNDLLPQVAPKPDPNSLLTSSDFQSERIQQRLDCFVAGTKVTTSQGLQSIELIRTGDLVLTKNMATGELEFKAVVRPTIRPTMKLVRVMIGDEVLNCSGGHFFCTVNQGWKKARDLQADMMVQGANGPAAVVWNCEGSSDRTYNLVVADNHNYFVGQTRLLTHDNTDLTVIGKTPVVATRGK